jgi:hypothetical protein
VGLVRNGTERRDLMWAVSKDMKRPEPARLVRTELGRKESECQKQGRYDRQRPGQSETARAEKTRPVRTKRDDTTRKVRQETNRKDMTWPVRREQPRQEQS